MHVVIWKKGESGPRNRKPGAAGPLNRMGVLGRTGEGTPGFAI